MKKTLTVLAVFAALAGACLAQEGLPNADSTNAGWSVVYPAFYAPTETSIVAATGSVLNIFGGKDYVLKCTGGAATVTNWGYTLATPFRVPGKAQIRLSMAQAETNHYEIWVPGPGAVATNRWAGKRGDVVELEFLSPTEAIITSAYDN